MEAPDPYSNGACDWAATGVRPARRRVRAMRNSDTHGSNATQSGLLEREECTTDDREDDWNWAHFGLAVVGAVVLGTLCRWLSNLTGGDEYGGRFDLPGVNVVTWMVFLLCAAVAVILGVAGVLRAAGAGVTTLRRAVARPPSKH